MQNLLDKRSRFAPSTSSLLASYPVPWLLAPSQPDASVPRWRLIRMLHREPTAPLVPPVRDARVLFGPKRRHYEGFMQGQVAQAHEFFCPMEALTAEGGHEDPDMRALIARASGGDANFMRMPRPAGRGRRGLWGWGAADTLRLSAPRTAPLGRGKQEGPVCGTGRV